MNIVINAVLSYEKPRGVGRYINNLLPAMAKLDKENQYYIYYGKWMQEYEFLTIKQENFHFIELDIKNTQVSRNLYLSIVLPLICKKFKPDLFFLVDTQALLIKPSKVLSTIHDLAEYVVPEKYSKKQAMIRRMIVKHQIHISEHIITVSNYSKRDIVNRFHLKDSKVSVIYNAVEMPDLQINVQPKNYFLYVSEIERAKNLVTLIKAYNLLDEEYKNKFRIEIVGKKGNDYENVCKLVSELQISEKIHFNGYVTDEELEKMYREAYAFVFPSVFEGFGLPVLEAMAKGVPVICSNASSIPEVGGEAVLTFSPYDEEQLVKQMITLICDTKLRNEMVNKGIKRAELFSKEMAASQTLDVIGMI